MKLYHLLDLEKTLLTILIKIKGPGKSQVV